MNKVLITGGAGFIGSHLVDRLLADGASTITVVDSFSDYYDPVTKRANVERYTDRPDFTLVEADICDAAAMSDLFRAGRFDSVIHLAARVGVRHSLQDPMAYEETNVRGTYVLLEAARQTGVPGVVFGSSSSVYGANNSVPFSEDSELPLPISPYAATKVAGEAACHAYSHLYDMRILCLRFFTVYGARQRPDLAIHKFARMISMGEPIPVYGDGSTSRDYTYVDDIVSGIIGAINYRGSDFEIINLGESRVVTLSSLISLIEGALGVRAKIHRQSSQAGDMTVTCADISKARRLLGYEPQTQIEAGIQKFVDWFTTRPSRANERAAALIQASGSASLSPPIERVPSIP